MTIGSQSASIAAQNIFTAALHVGPRDLVSISISGTFVATVTLQRRLDGTNWRDVQSWSGPIEASYVPDEGADLRIGVKTGNFTSGTALCRLGFGD